MRRLSSVRAVGSSNICRRLDDSKSYQVISTALDRYLWLGTEWKAHEENKKIDRRTLRAEFIRNFRENRGEEIVRGRQRIASDNSLLLQDRGNWTNLQRTALNNALREMLERVEELTQFEIFGEVDNLVRINS